MLVSKPPLQFFLKTETAKIYSTGITEDQGFTEKPNKRCHTGFNDMSTRRKMVIVWDMLKDCIQVLVLESLYHVKPGKTRKATEISLTLWDNIRAVWG